jgi:cysteine-rich repeat protein
MSIKLGLVAVVSLVGCTSMAQDPPSSDPPGTPVVSGTRVELGSQDPTASMPPEATFQFFPSLSNGTRPEHDTFAAERDMYISAAGTGAVAGDYYFQVTALVHTPMGNDIYYASYDALGCRRFRVAANGSIDLAYAAEQDGIKCGHLAGGAAGNLALQTMPFEDISSIVVTDAAGRRRYNVQVFPLAGGPFGDGAQSLSFYVLPTALPVCGDGIVEQGEECDDGNVDCGDGCSGECLVEHVQT